MSELAIIGGTGLTSLKGLNIARREVMHSPFGEPSGPFVHGEYSGTKLVFLARHGSGHTIPPHRVNYRANLWALQQMGVRKVIAVAAVGAIHQELLPGRIGFPHQIIDYTYGRDQTFFQDNLSSVTHIDFTEPYCPEIRQELIATAREQGLEAVEQGVYGATQGPRLETAAEIERMEREGCDMVGMTGMPEAALARELDLCYATVAVVANWAAGRGSGPIDGETIDANLKVGMERVRRLLELAITRL
jgi:5'-deoxy-5'-methylthioadenosine phosphorylase